MTTADVWEVIASAFVGALQAAGVFGPLIKLGVVPLTDPLFVSLFILAFTLIGALAQGYLAYRKIKAGKSS